VQQALVTNTKSWQTYTPKSDVDWQLLAGIEKIGKPSLGNKQDIKTGVIDNSGVNCESIWGTSDICYLTCKFTNEVCTPVK
jgi:hypothetical protein